LKPASKTASKVAKSSSAKRDTKCELLLRHVLWRRGLRYRVDARSLPGRPDVVFAAARVVVFCDGDFWHGRDLDERIAKLSVGHNAAYWIDKIKANVARDARNREALVRDGWLVLRFWESDLGSDTEALADQVEAAVRLRSSGRPSPRQPKRRRRGRTTAL